MIEFDYNTESAHNYYESILKEAAAINELLVEQEENNGWETGASGHVELEVQMSTEMEYINSMSIIQTLYLMLMR